MTGRAVTMVRYRCSTFGRDPIHIPPRTAETLRLRTSERDFQRLCRRGRRRPSVGPAGQSLSLEQPQHRLEWSGLARDAWDRAFVSCVESAKRVSCRLTGIDGSLRSDCWSGLMQFADAPGSDIGYVPGTGRPRSKVAATCSGFLSTSRFGLSYRSFRSRF